MSYKATNSTAHRIGQQLKLMGYRDFGELWASLTPQGRNLLTAIKEGRVKVGGKS